MVSPWASSTRSCAPARARSSRPWRGIVPDISALEPEMQQLVDDALRAKTAEFRQRLDNGEDLDDLLIEAFAVMREAAQRVIGQRHYDVQLMGGAALHFGWVAEMKTGEGKTLVSTLPAYLNGLSGRGMHIVTVNDYLARRDADWMGQIHRWLGLERRPGDPRLAGAARPEAGHVRLRHHLRHQQRVRLRLPPRQHGHHAGREGAARPRVRHRRRGRLHPHRRGPHPAHHLRAGGRRRQALLPVRLHRPQPEARRRLRGRRGEAHRRAHRGRHRPRREGPRPREPLRRGAAEPRAPAVRRAEGQGALQAGQGLHHPGRRGEDRRRVHRPHPGGPALVGGHPPGGGGQGGGEDQGGEPDPRHDHPPELLPHVREARRHDRHGLHRGGRADEHVRPAGRADPDEPRRWCGPTRPTRSTRPRWPSSTPSSRTLSSATSAASRCSSAPSRWRSPSTSPASCASGACRTRC